MNILIIYTGGTFGMELDKSGRLKPFNLSSLDKKIPEINLLGANVEVICSSELLDSSSVGPKQWLEYTSIIQDNYTSYQAYIILHGTDTMAFSASALSFLLKGTEKPIFFTGAQIPLGMPRNDARDNLLGAISVLVESFKESISIPEVCIYFNHKLLRANRSVKVESEGFRAFESHNYPVLADVGINIRFNKDRLLKKTSPSFSDQLGSKVTVVTFFPGILKNDLSPFFDLHKYEIVIVQSYGSGNFPVSKKMEGLISNFIKQEGVVLNVSQCIGGRVDQNKYEIGTKLEELGVIGMNDITLESCVAKSMYAQANIELKSRRVFLNRSVCGEMTV